MQTLKALFGRWWENFRNLLREKSSRRRRRNFIRQDRRGKMKRAPKVFQDSEGVQRFFFQRGKRHVKNGRLYVQIISQFTKGLLMLCRSHSTDIQELPLDGGQVLNPFQSNQFPLLSFLILSQSRKPVVLWSSPGPHRLPLPRSCLEIRHRRRVGYRHLGDAGAGRRRHLASRAVALLERKKGGRTAGAAAESRGARSSARPQAGSGLTQPRSPRNDLMPA